MSLPPQVRYAFLRTRVRPFIGLKGGLMANYTDFGAGRFAAPMIGVAYGRFALHVGYEWMMCGYRSFNMTWPEGSNPYLDPGYFDGYRGSDIGKNSLTVGLSFFF